MHRLFYITKSLANRFGGTRTDEWLWRTRHLLHRGWAEGGLSPVAMAHPQRQLLLDAIGRHEPIDSALEIGCAAGPNLCLLARRMPTARLVGLDINRQAVAVGRAFFARHHPNVDVRVGRADELDEFAPGAFDVVFTDAALIYIGPERIDGVVASMCRLARRGVVLVEYGVESGEEKGLENVDHRSGTRTAQRNAHWAHDWRALFARHAPGASVEMTRISAATWPGTWAEFGYVINVSLEPARG